MTLIPLWILSQFLVYIVSDTIVNQKLDKLRNQTTVLRNHIMTEEYLNDAKSDTVNADISQLSNLYNARIQIIDKNFEVMKDTYLIDQGKINISKRVLECFRGKNSFDYEKDTGVIEADVAILSKDSKNIRGVISISFSTDEVERVISKIQNRVLLVVILLMVLVLGVAICISGSMVHPFKKIEESIDRISEGNLNENIEIKGYYETEQITEAFNEMLRKLRELDSSRSEFVSNVSHELKTPITSIKVLADSLLQQENIPEEMYREFMQDIVTEIDRENAIITDLLTLVKLDKKAEELNIAPININGSVELILKRLRPIAAKKNIELVFESFRPVVAEVDEVKMNIVISNLVENAIKYNVLDGWVHISLNADHRYFYLKVADSGMGIPEESQEKIFDRFYRVDKSRSRDGDSIGGTGLGLSITKGIVLMHRGAIKVYSKEGEGTTFTVRIPLNYIK